MKASKILSLVLISGVFGLSFGICATTLQKEDARADEQRALETVNTSTDMRFLLELQKALEIRKYDLSNATRDQLEAKGKRCSGLQHKRHLKRAHDCKCPKCSENKNAAKDSKQK